MWHTARDDRKGALCEKVDSRICVFVCVDCHDFASAKSRNDRMGELACDVKVDSRIFELKTAFFGVELLALDLLQKLRLRLVLCF